MNSDTIIGFYKGTGRNQIPTITLASTTETGVTVNTDNGSGALAVLTVPSGGVVGASPSQDQNANAAITEFALGRQWGRPNGTNAPWFNSTSFDSAKPFTIQILGTATTVVGTTNSLTIKIYNNTAVTGTAFVSEAIASATTANIRFYINAACYWDSTSQDLTGVVSGNYTVAGTTTVIAPTALTSITSVASASSLNFVPSVTFGNAAGGTVSIAEFSISQQ